MQVDQLRDHIIKPTLMCLGFTCPSAINLLLGTAAQESHLGHYIVQKGMGTKGGLGIYQMEENTYNYVYEKYVAKSPIMKRKFKVYFGYDEKPHAIRLVSDLNLATAMARLYYWTFPQPLPHYNDIEELAKYWKKYWNTSMGKGTVEQFIENYKRYVEQPI